MAAELSVASILEAVLFVGGPPVPVARLTEVLRGVGADQIAEAVAELNLRYRRQGRPYEIQGDGRAYQMVLRPAWSAVAQRINAKTRTVRLSQAAVEVLALVAYRQPITAQEVDAIRGAGSSGVLRLLRRRQLVDMVKPSGEGDRSPRYVTTDRFIELFQLSSLDDLLKVQDLEHR